MVHWLLSMMLGVIAVVGCRASNPHNTEEDLEAADQRMWYGADGSSELCEAPAALCTNFQDSKDFIDLCVAKGFQARTCGCALRCSGKVDYVGIALTPNPPLEETPINSCPPALTKEAEDMLKANVPGGPVGRCLETHLCNGVLGNCADEELKTSKRLRELAGSGCESLVAGLVCRDGFIDSLRCPESNIALLSNTWAEFRSKDVVAKRCIHNFVCSGDPGSCNAAYLPQAQAIKKAVNHDGCDYWLLKFCSLGGSEW